jgi:YD repeat-containing protein
LWSVAQPLNRDTQCVDLQEDSENTGRTMTYNTASQLLTSTDAQGHTTTNTYDVRSRLAQTTDPNNIQTSYGYDDNNNLRTLTDGKGNTRAWFFDARNLNLAKQSSGATPPAPGSTNVPPAAAPGASATPDVVTYAYDALRRLTQKTAQDSSTTTHTYDLTSRLTQRDYSDTTTDTFT